MNILRAGAYSGATAVIIGAFGAHTLSAVLEPSQLQTFETGVRYHFYHSLAILICGFVNLYKPSPRLRMATASFLSGIVLFSGSLYLIAIKSVIGIENMVWLGPLTPLGGILFIAGWIFIVLSSYDKKSN